MKELTSTIGIESLLITFKDADEAILDELVHETCQETGLAELNRIEDEQEQDDHILCREYMASNINNAGMEEQIKYLLSAGVSEAEILEVLDGAD